ncbi:TRAP transporter small permease [Bacillus canaveralius]|uniref:TRAP transporter small permease n=1 Tax=Bacillus canaveralius TaxID=1403243 RepID=UPI000F7842B8|nr:TRAP transporter small permease [Bacillus canaveralius]RSK55154.1 TRAP transporter small permease [Bacillus canaveralius]
MLFLRFEETIHKIMKVLMTLSLMAMFISTMLQVAVRSLGVNIVGTADISLLNMSFLTFIGVGLAIYTKDQIAIESTALFSSGKIRFRIEIISSIFTLIFGIVLLYVFIPFFMYMLETGEKTLELGIPVAFSTGFSVIGAVLVILHSIGDILRLIYRKKGNMSSEDGGMER